ncbi:MAG: type II toxin-antitoxin system YafQ family toxin [Bacteroidales bacterium]|nr:type II toxin-antitoxin system YafQ family toxin [Bacteroidales bacterium]
MKIIRYTSQYKKDVKRYRNQPQKMAKVVEILNMLQNGQQIPSEFRPHMLSGNYKDCMECHVEGGFLLIWIDETAEQIALLRLGSHSELFK